MANLFVVLIIVSIIAAAAADIESLAELYSVIVNGPNRKVGFLSQGNYQAVAKILPSNVEVIIAADLSDLTSNIDNGNILAGLVTSAPPSGYHQFNAGVLSPQAMLVNHNSTLLLRALNAAIVRVLTAGDVVQYAKENEPQQVIQINTCYSNADYYPFPTAAELQDEPWFIQQQLNVAALGPNDWANAGNYLVSPPVGFWPDYYDGVEAQFIATYGPGFKFVRTYFPTSAAVKDSVYDGRLDVTEPYFLLNAPYRGVGVSTSLSPTCVTLGSDSTFYAKKTPSNPGLSPGVYAGIVIGGLALIAGVIFIVYMIVKEKKGEPLFAPLANEDPDCVEPKNIAQYTGELVVIQGKLESTAL